MWNLLAGLWRKIDRWLHRDRLPINHYRSNLHGRHR